MRNANYEDIMRACVAIIALFAIAACSVSRSVSRPGLGTTWGETRSSPVRQVSFERASGVPFAQATFFYDDSEGVEAMAGRGSSGGALADAGLETSVVDERGQPLETVRAADRIYVVGEEGLRYRLRVHNRTWRRVEVVASVDGLDVMDGRSASLEKRGYLLEPHETFTIDGFRRSQSEVAAFRFGSVSGSYAARTGDDRNVGVIGFAFFDERGARHYDDETGRRRDARPFPDSRYAQPPEM
jgi:hypothetical protein